MRIQLPFITQIYLPAAIRKIHMDPVIEELGRVRKGLAKAPGMRGSGDGNKVDLIDKATDYLMGAPAGLERDVDRAIQRTVTHPRVAAVLGSDIAQNTPGIRGPVRALTWPMPL